MGPNQARVGLGRGIPAIADRVEQVHRPGRGVGMIGEDGRQLGADLVGGQRGGVGQESPIGRLTGDGPGELDDGVVPAAVPHRSLPAVAELGSAEVEVAENSLGLGHGPTFATNSAQQQGKRTDHEHDDERNCYRRGAFAGGRRGIHPGQQVVDLVEDPFDDPGKQRATVPIVVLRELLGQPLPRFGAARADVCPGPAEPAADCRHDRAHERASASAAAARMRARSKPSLRIRASR